MRHGQADEVLEQEGVAQQEGVAHDQLDPPQQHAEDPSLLEQPVPAHKEVATPSFPLLTSRG